ERLHVTLRLHITTHHTKREERLSILQHHSRNQRVKRPLARSDHVGMLFEPEQRTAILKDNAGIASYKTGTEITKQTVDKRNGIAVFIDDRQIDRIAVLRKTGSSRGHGSIPIDEFSLFGRVLFRDYPGTRHTRFVGVRDV